MTPERKEEQVGVGPETRGNDCEHGYFAAGGTAFCPACNAGCSCGKPDAQSPHAHATFCPRWMNR